MSDAKNQEAITLIRLITPITPMKRKSDAAVGVPGTAAVSQDTQAVEHGLS
jgi:hypothetical protein